MGGAISWGWDGDGILKGGGKGGHVLSSNGMHTSLVFFIWRYAARCSRGHWFSLFEAVFSLDSLIFAVHRDVIPLRLLQHTTIELHRTGKKNRSRTLLIQNSIRFPPIYFHNTSTSIMQSSSSYTLSSSKCFILETPQSTSTPPSHILLQPQSLSSRSPYSHSPHSYTSQQTPPPPSPTPPSPQSPSSDQTDTDSTYS